MAQIQMDGKRVYKLSRLISFVRFRKRVEMDQFTIYLLEWVNKFHIQKRKAPIGLKLAFCKFIKDNIEMLVINVHSVFLNNKNG